jgi:nucleotide-binding universal stress UspA family protein
MPRFHHILFPVDYSPRCVATVPFVRDMLRTSGAHLSTLYSVPIPFYPPDVAWPGLIQIQEEDLEAAKHRLENFNREQFANVADGTIIQAYCDSGDPASAIIGFADRNEVDLIMMPTHGYGPFRSLLLGSVTAKVLHDAKCPVWTSAHIEDPGIESHVPIRSIVCGLDTKQEDLPVLHLAKCLAKEESAKLRVVHAYPQITGRPGKYFDQELEEDIAQGAWHELSKMEREAGVDADIIVEGGSVSEVVRDVVNRFEADLVVIGRGSLHQAFGRLRTNVYAIVRDSPRPVLSL